MVENLTALSHASSSVECALCISVLQHVFEVDKAIAEIIRVLKPGGKCLITNGYIFPICMEHDYYRLTPAFWDKRLENEPVDFEVIKLGNLYDALDNILMRPYGKYNGIKNIIHKFLSLPFKLLRNLVRKTDTAPLGVAVIITKNQPN
jgi:ubiquinone/menaquinone biosynthesis C-methylase UbiE